MKKISGVYKITNTATGDFYIGSSKNVKQRWACHKCHSTWDECPNNPLYNDMKRYGLDYFDFQILEEVEIDSLKEKEQKFIEILKPTYNNNNAKGLNIERKKEWQKEYEKTDKRKDYLKDYQKEYEKTDKCKEYRKSEKYKKIRRKASKKYDNQLCYYKEETLTLCALSTRFRKSGIEHPTKEAKKYLLKQESNNAMEFYDIYP